MSKLKVPLIFVIGMHRSGTSALTRALSLLGLNLPDDLLAPNQDNPFGYWEPKVVVDFNQRLLQRLGRHWSDPKPLSTDWQLKEVAGFTASDAAEILSHEYEKIALRGEFSGIVIKDPRLSRTMPVWLRAAQLCGFDVSCLIACRKPVEVFKSLQARDKMPREHALQLWLTYMLEAERGTRGYSRAVINYDDLVGNWRVALKGGEASISRQGLLNFGDGSEDVDLFLSARHRNQEVSIDEIYEEDPLESDVKDVYNNLLSPDLSENLEGLNEIDKRRIAYWSKRSPGEGESGLAQFLPAWYAEQSWGLLKQDRIEEAIDFASRAVTLAPDVMRFHYVLGNHLTAADRLEEAADCFRKANAVDGSQVRTHRALAKVARSLGNTLEAIDAIKRGLELKGATAYDHFMLGNLMLDAGELRTAVESFLRAIEQNDEQAAFHFKLSQTLARSNDIQSAINPALRAVILEPEKPIYIEHLGRLFELINRIEEAKLVRQIPEVPARSRLYLLNEIEQLAMQK